jgi:hypothetical protein
VSKFTESLVMSPTGRHRPLIASMSVDRAQNTTDWGVEYRLTVNFQAITVLSTRELEGRRIAQAKEEMTHLMVEELFGEFRIPLMELREKIYRGDTREAIEAVHEILKLMFEV